MATRIKEDYRQLTGPQKAAIFMLSLSEEQSSRMFAMMDDEEIKEISQCMANLGSIPATIIERLFIEFADQISATGSLVGSVVADNTTPAEQRAGAADRLVALGQVRAGALLLERIAPELLDPYMRYYLAAVGDADGTGSLAERFARRFDIPPIIREALQRQIEIVLGGI